MTGKRYVISELCPVSILDMDTGDTYPIKDEGIFETVCDLLNKQSDKIEDLTRTNTELEIRLSRELTRVDSLKEVNKELTHELEDLKNQYSIK